MNTPFLADRTYLVQSRLSTFYSVASVCLSSVVCTECIMYCG